MDMEMKTELGEDVRSIIRTLNEAGFEAYVVGGCVRDSLMGRTPSDWDITTSATPEQVKMLFRRTVDTGIRHGTVTVMKGRTGYEVTTFRIDGGYEDGRHPKQVAFTSSLKEDLCRRDFTINAMAYNDEAGLVDVFGGQRDIRDGVIRAVGDPAARFSEDALRIMRAFRFSAQLGFEVEEQTERAARQLAASLGRISAERVRMELVKLLMSDHPEYFMKLYEAGVTRVILPEFDKCAATPQNNPHHCYNVGEHLVKTLQTIKTDHAENDKERLSLKLAAIFHDFGKPDCRTTDENGIDHFHGHAGRSAEITGRILKRLKFDNETVSMVSALVTFHDVRANLTESAVRRCMHREGADVFRLLFDLRRADILSQSGYMREEKLKQEAEIYRLYRGVLESGDAITLKDLAIRGGDIMEMGVRKGPEIGRILNSLLEAVLEDPSLNTEKELRERAAELIKSSCRN